MTKFIPQVFTASLLFAAPLHAQTYLFDDGNWDPNNMTQNPDGSWVADSIPGGGTPAVVYNGLCWDPSGTNTMTFQTNFIDNNDAGDDNGIWDIALIGSSGSKIFGRIDFWDASGGTLSYSVHSIDSGDTSNTTVTGSTNLSSLYDPLVVHDLEWNVTGNGLGDYTFGLTITNTATGIDLVNSSNVGSVTNTSILGDSEICPNWCAKHDAGSFNLPVPEPSSAVLALLALGAFTMGRRR